MSVTKYFGSQAKMFAQAVDILKGNMIIKVIIAIY